MNAIVWAARKGIAVEWATMYMLGLSFRISLRKMVLRLRT